MQVQSAVSMQAEAPRLYDVETFSRLCSISVWTTRKYLSRGKIASVRIGARRLIPSTELELIMREGIGGGSDETDV